MNKLDYWIETVTSSFEHQGIKATQEQITEIAKDMETSHDCIGLAFHTPRESPYLSEVKELKTKLEKEMKKLVCRKCNGHGRLNSNDGVRSSNSECYECRGEGYV